MVAVAQPLFVGGSVATHPKVRFRLETGLSGEVRWTGLDLKRSYSRLHLSMVSWAVAVIAATFDFGWVRSTGLIRNRSVRSRTSRAPA